MPSGSTPTTNGSVTISQDAFKRMADQMRALTDGLAITRADVDLQKDGLTEARVELTGTRALLTETQEELSAAKATNAALKRQFAAFEPSRDFDKPGNGEQDKFNRSVLNNLMEAATALEENRPIDAAAFIKAGIAQLLLRNRHIRIADDSAMGWATVQEYISLSSADDAEEGKSIRRAEELAVNKKKRKHEASQRGGRGGGRGGKGRGGPVSTETSSEDPFAWFLQQLGLASQTTGGAGVATAVTAIPAAAAAAPAPVKRVLGPCYYCTGPHLQANCPILKNQQAIVQAHQAHLATLDGGTSKS